MKKIVPQSYGLKIGFQKTRARESNSMFKVKTTKFTIPQRGGEAPDIQVTRTQYIPIIPSKARQSKQRGTVEGKDEEEISMR